MAKKNTLFDYFTKNPNPKAAPTNTDSEASPAIDAEGKKSTSPKGKSITNGTSSSKGGAPCLHDLVWAKVVGHPYWPALVTAPPSGKAFVRDHAKQPLVHVRFFESPPSRAWVRIRLTKPFSGARHPEVPAQWFKPAWNKGVEQAEKALSIDPDDRVLLFPAYEDHEEDEDSSREEETDDEEEEEEGGDEPSRKKRRISSSSEYDDSSEDEFKPGKDDYSESDSSSSGVDENTISDLEPEPPEKTPQKQSKTRKQGDAMSSNPSSSTKSPAVRKLADFASPKTPQKQSKTCKQRDAMSSNPSSSTKSPAVRKLADFASPKAKSEAEQAAKGGAGATGLQTWAHLSYDFLEEGKRRDAAGRLPSHPEFNPRTLSVPVKFKAKLTPAMRQWWDMKVEHFDVVLFFKVGKFYELYHMDAVIGVEELGLVFMKGEVAHTGFPEIAYGRYSEALIQKGYKVARVEETETPKMMEERCRKMHRPTKFDRVVRREICRITSKATRTFGVQDGQLCDPEPSYLLAIAHQLESGESGSSISFGVCFLDSSVGKFLLGQFNDDHFCSRLRTAVSHYPPVRVLYENDQSLPACLRQVLEGPLHSVPREALRPWREFWDAPRTLKQLCEGNYFKEGYPEALGHFIDP
ncbi:DNA mismatch repair protein Msh6-like, partial [Amblyomma americanum]